MSPKLSRYESDARSRILLDATHQFCSRRKITEQAIGQYKELFYSLIAYMDHKNRKIISAVLARNPYTPRTIAYYLAMEPIEIAAPFLLISQSLQQLDLIRLAQKLETAHLNVIARRSDLSPELSSALVQHGDASTGLALKKNPVAKLNLLLGTTQQDRELDTKISKPDNGQHQRQVDREKLLAMVSKNKTAIRDNVSDAREITASTVSKKLLDAAKHGETQNIAQIVADYIQLPKNHVDALINSDEPEIYCLFLKAMNINRTQALQVILLTHQQVGKSVEAFNRATMTFDRLDAEKAQNILANMGAKNLPTLSPVEKSMSISGRKPTGFDRAIHSRKSEIRDNRGKAVFGRAQKRA